MGGTGLDEVPCRRIARENTKGRPQPYCDTKCRRAYDSGQAQLLLDQELLKEAFARPGGSFRERAVIKAALGSIEGCPLHYTYSAPAASED